MTNHPGPRACSIARSLDVLGGRWALLVLRELTLGVHRFDEMAQGTGASRDMLARRLRDLESAGLVVRRQYSDRPPRSEYHLTDRGRDAGGILLALMDFGDHHLYDTPPVRWHHGDPEDPHPLEPMLVCARCGNPATERLHTPEGPGAPSN